jgi:ankyrin repeat protein
MMVANAFDSRLFSPPKPEVAKPGSGFMAPFVYRDPRAYLAAVERGDIRSAMAQLDAGVDIDSMTADGDSALANAVYQGHGLLAAHLIERGADPNFANKQIGDTVLMWATFSTLLACVPCLRSTSSREWHRTRSSHAPRASRCSSFQRSPLSSRRDSCVHR